MTVASPTTAIIFLFQTNTIFPRKFLEPNQFFGKWSIEPENVELKCMPSVIFLLLRSLSEGLAWGPGYRLHDNKSVKMLLAMLTRESV